MSTNRPMPVPTTFPCLYLDGPEWEALPDRLADPFFRTLHECNLASLQRAREGDSAAAIFQAADSDEPNSIQRRTLKGLFQRAMTAWYCARQRQDLELAKAALTAACRSDQWRVQPGQIDGLRSADLATGELIHLVASGYDALWPYLDQAQRDECLRALIDKGLAAYLDGVELKDWWIACDFNWNACLHGNAGVAAYVVAHREPALAQRVLDAALEGLPYQIGSFQPGGGYLEGLMYLCTAMGHLTDFVVPHYRLAGEDLGLLSNVDFHRTIDFLIDFHGGDGKAYNFSDIGPGAGPTALAQVLWWAGQLERPDWTADQRDKIAARNRRPSHGGGLFPDVGAFWLAEPFQPAKPQAPRRMAHYKGIDWLAWRGERSWLAFRSGYNAGNHDNDDLGHFILGRDDERFLIDPGYGAYRASEHNCVTIRRHEQTEGAVARIERLDEREGGFYLDCDIQQAFPHVLAHYHRHLLLLDEEHLLLIDDIRSRGPVRADVRGHFQTLFPARITETGFAIDGPTQTLNVRFLSDIGGLKIVPWEFKGFVNNRLQYEDLWYRVHSVQVTLLSFGEPEVRYERTDDALAVTLAGRDFRWATDERGILRLA